MSDAADGTSKRRICSPRARALSRNCGMAGMLSVSPRVVPYFGRFARNPILATRLADAGTASRYWAGRILVPLAGVLFRTAGEVV